MRLLHEIEYHEDSCFITLTYNDDHIPEKGSLCKSDLQKFFKRLRKNIDERKIKYFACGEYGPKTFRPHYHSIIFGISISKADKNIVQACWRLGNIDFGLAEPDSIRYVAQYIDDKLYGELAEEVYDATGRERPFAVMSNGIGRRYCEDHEDEISECGITMFGAIQGIPRYYLDLLGIKPDKQVLKDIEYEVVKAHLGIDDMSYDDVYLKLDKESVMKLEDKIISARKQREMTLESKIALKNTRKL